MHSQSLLSSVMTMMVSLLCLFITTLESLQLRDIRNVSVFSSILSSITESVEHMTAFPGTDPAANVNIHPFK